MYAHWSCGKKIKTKILPDGNFIFDLHPGTENIFFLGGGSGHGFEHGPALGELVANVLSGDKDVSEIFSLFK
jgi:glycine/D-amino acid oxidase-like deaminating enzyme